MRIPHIAEWLSTLCNMQKNRCARKGISFTWMLCSFLFSSSSSSILINHLQAKYILLRIFTTTTEASREINIIIDTLKIVIATFKLNEWIVTYWKQSSKEHFVKSRWRKKLVRKFRSSWCRTGVKRSDMILRLWITYRVPTATLGQTRYRMQVHIRLTQTQMIVGLLGHRQHQHRFMKYGRPKLNR
jgi:hypothetical protein